MRGRSTPAEKIEPVPVRMTAFASRDSATLSSSVRNASQSSRSIALALPCASRSVRIPRSNSRFSIKRSYLRLCESLYESTETFAKKIVHHDRHSRTRAHHRRLDAGVAQARQGNRDHDGEGLR